MHSNDYDKERENNENEIRSLAERNSALSAASMLGEIQDLVGERFDLVSFAAGIAAATTAQHPLAQAGVMTVSKMFETVWCGEDGEENGLGDAVKAVAVEFQAQADDPFRDLPVLDFEPGDEPEGVA